MMTQPTPEQKGSHFNDWPNAVGLDAHYEERNPVELEVDGQIPSYVRGTLFRTGLGPRVLDTAGGGTFKVNHWFDNFSQVHRFEIDPTGKVIYNSRLTSDGLIEKAQSSGKLEGITFGKKYEPCKSFFKKVQSVFKPAREDGNNERNVGVTITGNYPGLSRTGDAASTPYTTGSLKQITMKTDASVFQILDPQTLEPVGIAEQSTLHPDLNGQMSAAHTEHDPQTGDVFNFNLKLGRSSTYKLFRTSTSTAKTSILASFTAAPAYVHSFFLSDKYAVLCIWNSHYTKGGASVLWNRNMLESMAWDGTQPATWYIIDKRAPEDGGKGLIAKFESDAFFCFHTVNAYEETINGKTDIVADLIGYEDMSVLNRFYFENMLSDSPAAARWSDPSNNRVRPTYRRYRLPSIPDKPTTVVSRVLLEHQSAHHDTPELPTINPKFSTSRHRYIYGICDTGLSTFADSLIKYDSITQRVQRWSKHGHTAGEAIFVPDPNSLDEDGGVLLTVVLDGHAGKSYLLILDAKTFDTVATAHVDGVVGLAFHGLWAGRAG